MSKKSHFRSSPRPQLTHTVTLHLENPTPKQVTGTTRDVGTGGLFVFTDEPLEVGEVVTIDLTTPCTWDPLTLKARVCRRSLEEESPGVALQFIDMSDETLVVLIQLIEALDFES